VSEDIVESGRLTDHLTVGVLTKFVPRHVVDQVIGECGVAERRVRLLPAHVVVYFVIAMAIFRDGYDEVIRALVHGLQFARTWSSRWTVPTRGAICQARVRLGENVMACLFRSLAVPVADASTRGAWVGSRRLMAIDGVMLDLQDTPDNVKEFPRRVGGTITPFPQARVVALSECGTHAVVAASIGSMLQGERELTSGILDGLEPGMLVLADRGFYSFELCRQVLATGADLAFRVIKTLRLPVLAVLADGSYISEIHLPHIGASRIQADKIDDITLATHMRVRVVEYTVAGTGAGRESEVFRVITNITDIDTLPAISVAQAYKDRWELELSFREIECQLRSTRMPLRSKTPAMVRQEIWGLLLAHWATRAFMAEAADGIFTDPDRISVIRTINIIRRSVTDPAAFSPRRTTHPPRTSNPRPDPHTQS